MSTKGLRKTHLVSQEMYKSISARTIRTDQDLVITEPHLRPPQAPWIWRYFTVSSLFRTVKCRKRIKVKKKITRIFLNFADSEVYNYRNNKMLWENWSNKACEWYHESDTFYCTNIILFYTLNEDCLLCIERNSFTLPLSLTVTHTPTLSLITTFTLPLFLTNTHSLTLANTLTRTLSHNLGEFKSRYGVRMHGH